MRLIVGDDIILNSDTIFTNTDINNYFNVTNLEKDNRINHTINSK